MKYKNTEEVLEKLKSALESECGEKLEAEELYAHSRNITFRSDSFQFDVYFSFIQARVLEDFNQSIEQRLREVLSGVDLSSGGHYELTSRSRGDVPTTEIPIEYCILRA